MFTLQKIFAVYEPSFTIMAKNLAEMAIFHTVMMTKEKIPVKGKKNINDSTGVYKTISEQLN